MFSASYEEKLREKNQIFLWKPETASLLGESGCIALLGGLRAPLAAWLWLKVEACWEEQGWKQMEPLLELILQLEPYDIPCYTMAAWELGWNASSAAHDEGEARFYINAGQRVLEQGIAKNPESSLLYEYLGVLLRDRLHDHEAAAAAFAKGANLPGAHSYLRRFVVYELAASGKHDQEAYEQLQELYEEGHSEWVPALLDLKEKLENKTQGWRK
ncbi:MAG: hypothetical protein ACOYK6_00225 [Chthoniobacterales bacterium]